MPDADLLRVPVGPGFLHVERYGLGGAPIVLLHGFPTSSFLWRAVGPALAAAGHTAFAIELLGYGQSDRPYEGDFSVAAQAEYLDRALIALRATSVVMVGQDVGGGVALRLAVTRPTRVRRLVLLNSVAFDEWPGEDVKSVQGRTARFAVRISRGLLGAAPLLTPVLEKSVARPEHMPPRLVARYLAPFVGTEGVIHLLGLARALDPADLAELDLSAIAVPTLIVRGAQDPWLDSAVAHRLHAAIPGSILHEMPDIGHLIPEDAPDELSTLVANFVGTPAAASG